MTSRYAPPSQRLSVMKSQLGGEWTFWVAFVVGPRCNRTLTRSATCLRQLLAPEASILEVRSTAESEIFFRTRLCANERVCYHVELPSQGGTAKVRPQDWEV